MYGVWYLVQLSYYSPSYLIIICFMIQIWNIYIYPNVYIIYIYIYIIYIYICICIRVMSDLICFISVSQTITISVSPRGPWCVSEERQRPRFAGWSNGGSQTRQSIQDGAPQWCLLAYKPLWTIINPPLTQHLWCLNHISLAEIHIVWGQAPYRMTGWGPLGAINRCHGRSSYGQNKSFHYSEPKSHWTITTLVAIQAINRGFFSVKSRFRMLRHSHVVHLDSFVILTLWETFT